MTPETAVNPTFRGFYYSEERNCLLDSKGERIQIRPKSLAVFRYLAKHPRKVISKQQLFEQVWPDVIVTDDALGKCIREIRQVLGDDDRKVLQSVPSRGYLLEPDDLPASKPDATRKQNNRPPSVNWKVYLPLALLIVLGVALLTLGNNKSTSIGLKSENGTPTIKIDIDGSKDREAVLKSIAQDTRIALSRYHSVIVLDEDQSDFSLRLSSNANGDNAKVALELIKNSDNRIVYAEKIKANDDANSTASNINEIQTEKLGRRVAGLIGSPGSGAISRYLLQSARHKDVDELTRAECYSFGYDCTNCSGELDSINEKAEACLARILKEDPKDARAWGLQSTIYAHQYQWSTGLAEPERTTLSARAHLPDLAIQAANRAEQLSDGTDTSVYWGMAQAYSASCEIDKLRTVVDRGLKINPYDPSLLAAFGNWIAYAGHWNDGAEMINRALEIEPRNFQSWWLFGIAKSHYANGDYENALKVFLKSYNERNWLTHLQLAYTLPHLGRVESAIKERKKLERMMPGVTIENVLQFYKIYCFDDAFLEKIHWALEQAGLPSKSNIESYHAIKPPEAKVIRVNGFDVEYMDVGQGTPVVFVHGSISDYRAWSYFQNPISENHRYISYSRRYSGSQPWPDDGKLFGINSDIDDLIAFVEMLDIGPVFTVSWSRGGRISSMAAVERPDLFLGAIHFEPIANSMAEKTDDSGILKAKEAFFSRFEDSSKQFNNGRPDIAVAMILENVFEIERGRIASEIMPLRRMNLDSAAAMNLQVLKDKTAKPVVNCKALNETTTPTLVLLGGETNAWWSHVVKSIHNCIPTSTLTLVPSVNHDGPIRKPKELTEFILEFVSQNEK